ncbi:MAG TPA: glycosyltransferase, partial [Kineosporiaceae bacterium]
MHSTTPRPAGSLPRVPTPTLPSADRLSIVRRRPSGVPAARAPRTAGAAAPSSGPAPNAVAGRYVLLVGLDHGPDRATIALHTGGLVEHLTTSAASVTLRRGAGPAHGRLGGADDLTFLTGALTTPLPQVPDLVLAVTPGLGGAVAAARIARRHRAPFVIVVHDLVSARPAGRYHCRRLRVAEAAERWLLPRATEVAVVNPDLSPVVRTLGVPAEHVHLLPRWTSAPAVDVDRSAARRALGWPVRPFTVVAP